LEGKKKSIQGGPSITHAFRKREGAKKGAVKGKGDQEGKERKAPQGEALDQSEGYHHPRKNNEIGGGTHRGKPREGSPRKSFTIEKMK